MISTSHRTLIAASISVFMIGAAQAGLIIDRQTPEQAQAEAQAAADAAFTANAPQLVIRHVGDIDPNVPRVRGGMKNKPIQVVLSSLVPKGWAGWATDVGVKSTGLVSYEGAGRPWPAVIEEVLRANGLVATIDWNSHKVVFGVSAERKQLAGATAGKPDQPAMR